MNSQISRSVEVLSMTNAVESGCARDTRAPPDFWELSKKKKKRQYISTPWFQNPTTVLMFFLVSLLWATISNTLDEGDMRKQEGQIVSLGPSALTSYPTEHHSSERQKKELFYPDQITALARFCSFWLHTKMSWTAAALAALPAYTTNINSGPKEGLKIRPGVPIVIWWA